MSSYFYAVHQWLHCEMIKCCSVERKSACLTIRKSVIASVQLNLNRNRTFKLTWHWLFDGDSSTLHWKHHRTIRSVLTVLCKYKWICDPCALVTSRSLDMWGFCTECQFSWCQMQCLKDDFSRAVWLSDHREALMVLVWNKKLHHVKITFIHPSQITVCIYGRSFYFLLLSFPPFLCLCAKNILPPHHSARGLWKSR